MVICLERGADLHMAQLMPLPLTVSCSSKIHIGIIFLVPVHPVSPGKRAVKGVCVCVCVCYMGKIDCFQSFLFYLFRFAVLSTNWTRRKLCAVGLGDVASLAVGVASTQHVVELAAEDWQVLVDEHLLAAVNQTPRHRHVTQRLGATPLALQRLLDLQHDPRLPSQPQSGVTALVSSRYRAER